MARMGCWVRHREGQVEQSWRSEGVNSATSGRRRVDPVFCSISAGSTPPKIKFVPVVQFLNVTRLHK
jgi:hypothetical protein